MITWNVNGMNESFTHFLITDYWAEDEERSNNYIIASKRICSRRMLSQNWLAKVLCI